MVRLPGRAPLWVWFGVDQALSSITNLGVVVVLANTLDVDALSDYIVLFSIHQLGLGLVRTVVGESHLARVVGRDGRSRHNRPLGAGVVVGLVVAAVGLAVSGVDPVDAVVLGASVPVVFAQDVLRYRALAGPRPWRALLSDSAWIAASAAVLAGAAASGSFGAGAAVAAWGTGALAALATLVGLGQATAPAATGAQTETGALRRDLQLAADHLLARGLTDVSLIVLGLVGAAGAVSGVKGAQVLAAPAVLLVSTWRSLVLRTFGPAGVTPVALAVVRRNRWWVAALLVVVVGPGALIPGVAERLLGDAADVGRRVVLFWLALLVARVVMLADYGALRALGRSQAILRGRLLGVLLVVPAVAVAALADSGVPVALGLTASALGQAVMYRALGRPHTSQRARSPAGRVPARSLQTSERRRD